MNPGARVRSLSAQFAGEGEVLAVKGQHAVVELPSGDVVRAPLTDLEVRADLGALLLDGPRDDAEHWLLRYQAQRLVAEQQSSGMISALRVEPLPHQVLAAHFAVDGSDGRVVLADDVGMGKTIEIGLALAVLRARGEAERILILCPASLRRQWQSELHTLFGLWCDIAGDDFNPSGRRSWELHHRVIASIDLLKRPAHRKRLDEAPPWDVLIVDEAHRLGARFEGGAKSSSKLYRTQNFRLATEIGESARRVLLATATPHQGRDDQFLLLLSILRPGWKPAGPAQASDRVAALRAQLGEVMVRTPKRMGVDWQQRPIFKGSVSRTVRVPTLATDADIEAALRAYIAEGFNAYERAQQQDQRGAVLINFVMTSFLKIASSSRAALRRALDNRARKLEAARANEARRAARRFDLTDDDLEGEEAEDAIARFDVAFFDRELDDLRGLIALLDDAGPDPKIAALVDELERVRQDSPSGVLVFTEYRASQDAIVQALRDRFGSDTVAQIRGGQGEANDAAAARFQSRDPGERVPFLVSTQAGGEGLNLQHGGHVLVNFDLPWNPMRVLQRIGRLDRYGQAERVAVLNLMRDSQLDAKLLDKAFDKLRKASEAVAAARGSSGEDLLETVLGDFVDGIDLTHLLREALLSGNAAKAERILDQHVERVREAAERSSDLLQGLDAFRDQADVRRPETLAADVEHFCSGVLAAHGRRVSANPDGTWRFLLPDAWRGQRGLRREYERIVFDPVAASRDPRAAILGFGQPVFEKMIGWSLEEAAPNGVTCLRVPGIARPGLLAGYAVRLFDQAPGGRQRTRFRFVSVLVGADAEAVVDPDLRAARPSGESVDARVALADLRATAQAVVEAELSQWIARLDAAPGAVSELHEALLAWVTP